MEFTEKFKEATDTFVAEAKTNLNELKYTVESTLKNAASEAQDEIEIQKNFIKSTAERIQEKLKGPFTVEKIKADVEEEGKILVADVKTTFNRNAERVRNVFRTAESKVEAVKNEVKKTAKASKAKAEKAVA
jgi:hypothetical protein